MTQRQCPRLAVIRGAVVNDQSETLKCQRSIDHCHLPFLPSVILWQIPIPDHEFDLGPQHKPNLTVDSSPLSILRETLLRAVTVLEVSSSYPRSPLLRPWTGRCPAMESAPAFTGNCGLLAWGAAARLCKASLAGPRVTKTRSFARFNQCGVFGLLWCAVIAIHRVI